MDVCFNAHAINHVPGNANFEEMPQFTTASNNNNNNNNNKNKQSEKFDLTSSSTIQATIITEV